MTKKRNPVVTLDDIRSVWNAGDRVGGEVEHTVETLHMRILQLEAVLKYYAYGAPSEEYPWPIPDYDSADRAERRATWLAKDAGRLARKALKHSDDTWDYETIPLAWLDPEDRHWIKWIWSRAGKKNKGS